RYTPHPGLVHTCPTPNLSGAGKALMISTLFLRTACSMSTTGFMELISAYPGIGLSLLTAALKSLMPTPWDPVNPTAFIWGCSTSFIESSWVRYKEENTPSGIPVFCAAFTMALDTRELVPGWEECAFTTTGQPEARAEAVSPPAVENAKGKLLAPNTATGPIGTSILLISGFGMGLR